MTPPAPFPRPLFLMNSSSTSAPDPPPSPSLHFFNSAVPPFSLLLSWSIVGLRVLCGRGETFLSGITSVSIFFSPQELLRPPPSFSSPPPARHLSLDYSPFLWLFLPPFPPPSLHFLSFLLMRNSDEFLNRQVGSAVGQTCHALWFLPPPPPVGFFPPSPPDGDENETFFLFSLR